MGNADIVFLEPDVLQWGRGQVTAEIGTSLQRPSSVSPLQWGRGQVTAEIPQKPSI